MNVSGKVIAITGGGKGIGRGIAMRLAAAGANLALLDLNDEDMAETVAACADSSNGSTMRSYNCNVTDETRVEAVFAQIAEEFGALHGLVNNAGILRDGLLIKVKDGEVVKKMPAEQFDIVIDVHLKGAFLCAREAAVQMINTKASEGCIINMSSGSFRGNFGQSNYSAAKAGLVAMTRVWSKELAQHNIRSMAIAPGVFETDMTGGMPEHVKAKLNSAVPLQRMGQPDNIAQAVQQILENDYMTGGVIDVSGGWFL